MHTSHNANKIFLKFNDILCIDYCVGTLRAMSVNYIIALGLIFSFENAKSFLPRSLSDAPMW